ncbi:MAG TPA: hypothetical protein VG076_09020 [Acidimicrobiales bacterium]|nr:hypothetical protein [Acidimicrobiales bacterium]
MSDAGEHRDELPEELDVSGYVGQYTFPDIARRRIPAVIYLVIAALSFLLWVTHRGPSHVLVNEGFLWVAVALALVGLYHLAAAWPLNVGQTDALVAAVRRVGFPVGHASGQLGWTGLRSRPVWRILLYSAEDPPQRRGVVLVDAVNADVLFDFVEDNPEDWSSLSRRG